MVNEAKILSGQFAKHSTKTVRDALHKIHKPERTNDPANEIEAVNFLDSSLDKSSLSSSISPCSLPLPLHPFPCWPSRAFA